MKVAASNVLNVCVCAFCVCLSVCLSVSLAANDSGGWRRDCCRSSGDLLGVTVVLIRKHRSMVTHRSDQIRSDTCPCRLDAILQITHNSRRSVQQTHLYIVVCLEFVGTQSRKFVCFEIYDMDRTDARLIFYMQHHPTNCTARMPVIGHCTESNPHQDQQQVQTER